MLKAKIDNQIIDLTKLSRTEIIAKRQSTLAYRCPHCEGTMILKYGQKKRAHFAHKKPCVYRMSESESEEHLVAKLLFSSYLERQGAQAITLEKRFNDILRIADLYFEWEGNSYVIEIQKSMLAKNVFEERIKDYQSKGIEVIWVFIGELKEKAQTYLLNKVMILNKERALIHLNILNEELSIFNQLIWLNQKEVKGQVKRVYLRNLLMSDLISPHTSCDGVQLTEWLAIKKEFRLQKWQQYVRSEKALTRLCYSHRMSLSLIPSEIGLPILNHHGFNKPLFIWQAYVLMGGIMSYEIHQFFTITDLVAILKSRFHLNVSQQAFKSLKCYLNLLVQLNLLKDEGGYYEVLRYPTPFSHLEEAFENDLKIGQKLIKKN